MLSFKPRPFVHALAALPFALASPAGTMTRRSVTGAVALCALTLALPAPSHAAALQRYVSNDPAFVLFRPQGWNVRSGASGGALRITVSDPAGTSAAESVYAGNPRGGYNGPRLLGAKLREIGSNHPELAVTDVQICNRDASCAVATLSYELKGVPIRGRFFFHADPQLISIRSYIAPVARFSSERALLLDILANLRVLARQTAGAMQGLYDAIHENQSDYEARAARKDAQDARGDDYRRGNSYWISDLEGGKVYATDPWGTADTSNGDRYEGSAYDYIHFDGHNPVHPSENMHEVSSYDLKQMGY